MSLVKRSGLLLFWLLVSVQAVGLDVTNRGTVEAFIDGAVKPLMQNKHGPAGVVLVMKDGKVILNKGYGYQDLERRVPVDAYNTLFRPGSISKLFTWIAVLQMEEQGKLDLDTDVNEYLTRFKVKDTWEGQPVTMRHIMTHRGGFEDGFLGYLIIDDADRIMPLAEALEMYQPERINPPGDHTSYSNWATALAGLIVANLSGVEFNQYLQENIFDVLGMEHATFVEPLPPELDAMMAKHYQYPEGRFVEKPYEIISNFGPAGALAASAGSMERFGRALLNGGELDGGRILQPETVQRFLDQDFSHHPETRGMGLGTIHYPYNGIDVVGHDGGTTTFVSHFGLAPEEGFLFYVSFNGPAAAGIVYEQLVWPFYDAFFPPAHEELTPPADFAERGVKYAGTYHTWRNSFTKIESLLRMATATEVVVTPEGTLMIGTREFVEEGENLFRELHGEARYAFQVDEAGNPTGMISDGFAVAQYFKAPWYTTAQGGGALFGLSLVIFLGVLLRWFYQRRIISGTSDDDRGAIRLSNWLALLNWIFVLVVGITVAVNADSLFYEVPTMLKVSLVLPPVLIAGALYQAFKAVEVWRYGLLTGLWGRIRYTVVTLAMLFAAWFYYYWNLLGLNYF